MNLIVSSRLAAIYSIDSERIFAISESLVMPNSVYSLKSVNQFLSLSRCSFAASSRTLRYRWISDRLIVVSDGSVTSGSKTTGLNLVRLLRFESTSWPNGYTKGKGGSLFKHSRCHSEGSLVQTATVFGSGYSFLNNLHTFLQLFKFLGYSLQSWLFSFIALLVA